jgi:hypothetical protein
MVQSLEDAGKAGKEFLDAGLKNFASLSKNVQALAVEATEYSRKSFEEEGRRDPDRLRPQGL